MNTIVKNKIKATRINEITDEGFVMNDSINE